MFVVSGIQHAMRMRRVILSSMGHPTVPYYPTFSHKRHDFRGGGNITDHKVCVLILSATFVWNTSLSKKKMYICLHVKLDFIETWIWRKIFVKYWNIKFREILSSGSRVLPFGRTDETDRQRDGHDGNNSRFSEHSEIALTLIVLMLRIGWAHNNTRK